MSSSPLTLNPETDPADHHVALVLAQAVPGVVHAEVVHSTPQRA
ncbi:MAG: hypothetical protein ACRDRP_09775 [Pseudonocardiaceae bacterium]